MAGRPIWRRDGYFAYKQMDTTFQNVIYKPNKYTTRDFFTEECEWHAEAYSEMYQPRLYGKQLTMRQRGDDSRRNDKGRFSQVGEPCRRCALQALPQA